MLGKLGANAKTTHVGFLVMDFTVTVDSLKVDWTNKRSDSFGDQRKAPKLHSLNSFQPIGSYCYPVKEHLLIIITGTQCFEFLYAHRRFLAPQLT